MSYCRFSSDNWTFDIYCYEHRDGQFQIHVANNRLVGDIPTLPAIGSVSDLDWMIENKTQMDFLAATDREAIDLPHAGESFSEATAEACALRLELLRALGYHVPQRAIDALREEAAS